MSETEKTIYTGVVPVTRICSHRLEWSHLICPTLQTLHIVRGQWSIWSICGNCSGVERLFGYFEMINSNLDLHPTVFPLTMTWHEALVTCLILITTRLIKHINISLKRWHWAIQSISCDCYSPLFAKCHWASSPSFLCGTSNCGHYQRVDYSWHSCLSSVLTPTRSWWFY